MVARIEKGPGTRFHPALIRLGVLRLLRRFRHSRRFLFLVHGLLSFTFLLPFAPRALPRFITLIAALTPAPSLLSRHRSPHFLTQYFPTFRRQPSDDASYFIPLTQGVSRASPLARRLAASPDRIAFVFLRTIGLLPVALHPSSRTRSYFQLRGRVSPRHGLAPCCTVRLVGARAPASSRLMYRLCRLAAFAKAPSP